jgi:8-oxo-dGTP diphosphatase
MKTVEVAAGVIRYGTKFLCVQRKESELPYISKKYEFPGGKIEHGETIENALIREIKEELDMVIFIKEAYMTVEHRYPDFYLIMHTFICEVKSQELKLKEHISHKWLSIDEIENLDWAAADIPIVNRLIMNG